MADLAIDFQFWLKICLHEVAEKNHYLIAIIAFCQALCCWNLDDIFTIEAQPFFCLALHYILQRLANICDQYRVGHNQIEMFSFKDKEEGDKDTPFFNETKEESSIFVQTGSKVDDSAYSLFNQSKQKEFHSKKSFIVQLDEFDKEEAFDSSLGSPAFFEPTQTQESSEIDEKSQFTENSIIEEVKESVEEPELEKSTAKMILVQSRVKDFNRMLQTNPEREKNKDQKRLSGMFTLLTNSRAETKNEEKNKFKLNFKKSLKESTVKQVEKEFPSSNESTEVPKVQSKKVQLGKFNCKFNLKNKEENSQFSKEKFTKPSFKNESKDLNAKEILKKDQPVNKKYFGMKIPEKSEEKVKQTAQSTQKQEGKKLNFSIADQIAKRDKLASKIHNFQFQKKNKKKPQIKVEQKVIVKKPEMPLCLNLKNSEELKFKEKLTVKQQHKKQVLEKNNSTSHTASKHLLTSQQHTFDRRLTENKRVSGINSGDQLNSYYSEIENVMGKLEEAKQKLCKGQEGYKNLHILAKGMSNNLNYGFQEQEDKKN